MIAKMKKDRNKGFSLVEVLIVIVIIGILAVIVLVSYNNVTVAARNSQTTAAVTQYMRAIKLYALNNRAYPSPITACLGDGYGDYDGDGSAGDCWHLSSPAKESTTFENNLRPYLQNFPMPSTRVLNVGPFNHVGAIFQYSTNTTIDGVMHRWFIAYTMEGNGTKCPIGPVLTLGTWPAFTSTTPSSGYSSSWGTVATECWIALPEPTDL